MSRNCCTGFNTGFNTTYSTTYGAQYNNGTHSGGAHRQQQMSRREVTLKQDTQHCINIFGRAMSAIERYMVFLNLPIRRRATYYDGTHVNPREVPEAHLIEEMKMQLTVAYASLHSFMTTYGSGPKELIAEVTDWANSLSDMSDKSEVWIDAFKQILSDRKPVMPHTKRVEELARDSGHRGELPLEATVQMFAYAQHSVMQEDSKMEANPNSQPTMRLNENSVGPVLAEDMPPDAVKGPFTQSDWH